MNDLSTKSGTTGPRTVRLMRVLGVLSAAAAAVLLFLHFRQTSQSTKQETNGEGSPVDASSTAARTNPAGRPEAARMAGAQESVLDRLIRVLNDASLSLEERHKAIVALAQDGSDEAVAALKAALSHSSKEIRLAIADALGGCRNPAAVAILKDLLHDPDLAIARAAIQSLAQQDQSGAATALSDLLGDSNASIDLRCAAALALGESKQPWVLDPLARIAWDNSNPDLTKAALDAIAKLDFNDSKSFFQQYLASPDVSPEMRLDAISALAQVQGDPTALLMQLAQDSNPDVRAAAAIALSATEASGSYGAQLVSDLQNEKDPNVRARLYQALENQGSYDTAAALAMVENEKDPMALVAGLDLLSRAARDNPNDAALQSFFSQTGISELKDVALNSKILDVRQEAVVALTSLAIGGNKQAIAALNDVRTQLPQQQAQNGAAPGASNPARNPSTPQPHTP